MEKAPQASRQQLHGYLLGTGDVLATIMEIAPQASRQQLHGCTLGTGEVSATIMEIAPQASRQQLHGCTLGTGEVSATIMEKYRRRAVSNSTAAHSALVRYRPPSWKSTAGEPSATPRLSSRHW